MHIRSSTNQTDCFTKSLLILFGKTLKKFHSRVYYTTMAFSDGSQGTRLIMINDGGVWA